MLMPNGQQTGQNSENLAYLETAPVIALVANQSVGKEKSKVWYNYHNKAKNTRETC